MKIQLWPLLWCGLFGLTRMMFAMVKTESIFHWCTQYLDEYWAATAIPIIYNQPLESRGVPPVNLVYKVNMDGAVFSSQKQAGIGMIIRDSQGNFIASLSKKLYAPLGAIEAKAKAFEEGIVFAGDIGIQNFVVEDDCLAIVQALRDVSLAPSSVAPLVYGMSCNLWITMYKFFPCSTARQQAYPSFS